MARAQIAANRIVFAIAILSIALVVSATGQDVDAFLGRWSLTFESGLARTPELVLTVTEEKVSGTLTLFRNAPLDIERARFEDGVLHFEIPSRMERSKVMQFTIRLLENETLRGTMTGGPVEEVNFSGQRAKKQ